MTRVPTLANSNRGLTLIQQLNVAVNRAQEQISTGRAILTPADDPTGAAQSLILERSVAALDQYSRNAGAAESRLQREEVALDGASKQLQRVRELVLQAANSSQSVESLGFIAAEIRQNLAELVNIANSQDGNGRYLFAGFRSETTPFSFNGSQYLYNGDQGEKQIQVGENRFITDGNSGDEVFMRIRRANGVFTASPATANTGTGALAELDVLDASLYDNADYTIRFTGSDTYDILDTADSVVTSGSFTPGQSISFNGLSLTIEGEPQLGDDFLVEAAGYQDVFSSLNQIASALETQGVDGVSRAKLTSTLNRGLENIDQALGTILTVRTEVGTRLQTIESQVDTNDGYKLFTQEALADIRDLDYTAAITTLTQNITALEAAQQSFVRIQGLSLFNVL